MKKIFISIGVYSILASIACFVSGFLAAETGFVCPQDILSYKICNGLLYLLKDLPSAVITAFLVGAAVDFGSVLAPSKRFSAPLIAAFRTVMIISIFCTFGLYVCHAVVTPVLEQHKMDLEQKPVVIKDYLNVAEDYLNAGLENPESAHLALFYSKKVLELDPGNEKALALSKRAELAGAVKNKNKDRLFSESIKDELKEVQNEIGYSDILKIHSSTVYELVQEAELLFEKEDYLGAHYYAEMAVRMAGTKDINYDRARELSNKAWNIINQTQAEKVTEENLFFRKKVEGYKALNAGDFLSSYYIFQTLNNTKGEYARDPDVRRYLNISRDELTKQYFFIDETENKDAFASAENVYFSLRHHDGTYDIFYIKEITDITNSGNLVRYLRELNIYTFDAFGNFKKAMVVPYAKMLAVSIDELTPEQKTSFGVEENWKMIPYVMLCSVDRNIEGTRFEPTYYDSERNKIKGDNQMYFALPFDDFEVLSKSTDGVQKANFWNMQKMKRNADYYGFSSEIILETVLSGIFYPFMILITMIFVASIGWNYRLKNESLFKFVWIFIVPVFHIIVYGAMAFFDYFIKIMNYIFIGTTGVTFAMFTGLAFYTILVIIMCVLFLSRKGD